MSIGLFPETPYTFAFTSLVEPTTNVSADPPASFDAGLAYFLGQCCEATYTQFVTGSISASSIEAFSLEGSLSGYTISVSTVTALTVSEILGPASVPEEAGTFVTIPAGFIAPVTFTNGTESSTITVVALRGTQTWEEWLDDAAAFPTPFGGVVGSSDGLGSVHAGFYAYYTVGTNGATAQPGNEVSPTPGNRATGSIAQQIANYFSTGSNGNVWVTGHSLGGAIAGLCALDIASNFGRSVSSVSCLTLASPRIAVGVATPSFSIPTLGNQQTIVANFQSLVQDAWAIVHAADIVPISPPLATSLGGLTLSCAQVTAAVAAQGSGATATASISSSGSVTSINVTSKGSNYSSTGVPVVVLSGGGGSGATAYATVDVFGHLTTVTVANGGSGYTSAPSVQFVNTTSPSNIINFCAQTGDIEGNHSCLYTYLPYLQQLANGF